MKTNKRVLDLKMRANDMSDDGCTIGEYLMELLRLVWQDGEGFSGKRPWGNSCWELPVYEALVEWEVIKGDKTEQYHEGELDYIEYDYDTKEAHKVITKLLKEMKL